VCYLLLWVCANLTYRRCFLRFWSPSLQSAPISAIHVNGRVDSKLKQQAQQVCKTAKNDMRFEPKIKSIVQAHIDGSLDNDEFPYHGTPAMDGLVDRENIYGPRVIVFIAGGATYSEIRVLNEILNGQVNAVEEALAADAQFTSGGEAIRSSKIETIREVILGSTSIVTPNLYVPLLLWPLVSSFSYVVTTAHSLVLFLQLHGQTLHC